MCSGIGRWLVWVEGLWDAHVLFVDLGGSLLRGRSKLQPEMFGSCGLP